MALTSRYNQTHKGAMTLVGNALCVSQGPGSWTPFVYMSTIPTNQVAGYLSNTVSVITQAYSSTQLNIPPGSTVRFAQLFWYSQGSAASVTFITPNGTSTITATISVTDGTYYFKAADVTTAVNSSKSGTYTVGNLNGATSYPGWGLIVVYENPDLPTRYFNVYSGLQTVNTTTPAPLTFTGFITPSSGPVKGYMLLGYGRGDLIDQAKFKVGPNSTSLTTLGNPSTNPWNGVQPYSKSTSMFPGIICFADANDSTTIGLLNTQSTLSTRNIDPYAGTYGNSSRSLFDITGLDISSTLTNNQSQLYTTIIFTGGAASADSLLQAVQVDMNTAKMSLLKAVDKSTAYYNDQLTYTVGIFNIGQLDANNVIFVDTIPSGTSFVPGSFSINGTTTIANPSSPGVSLGTIAVGNATTVSFKVTVTTTPRQSTGLQNSGNIYYKYIPSVVIGTLPGSDISNNVVTTLPVAALIDTTKVVDKKYADIGDILTYTTTIPNTGLSTALNVVFRDTIPSGTSFVTNSLILNGVTLPGSNPQTGITVGTLPVNTVATINFKVQVNTIPSLNQVFNTSNVTYNSDGMGLGLVIYDESNTVSTRINHASLISSKNVSKLYARVGDTLLYTVNIINSGSTSANGVIFLDTTPIGTSFVASSLVVNGFSSSGNPNPPGVNIGTIPAGSTFTVSFNVLVNTIPTQNPIPNSSNATFSYIVDPSIGSSASGSTNSNIVNTQINTAKLSNITKYTDKNYSICGGTITYSIIIPNSGNVTASNVILRDTIPNGTSLVDGSVIVDGVTQPLGTNPQTGVNVGTIAPGGISTVTFQVVVLCN